MTAPKSSPPWSRKAAKRGRARHLHRHLALVSVLCFWAAVLALALPAAAHADSNSLASYGTTASAWAIQPYVVNDSFLNVPVADEAAPYVYISMDNTPGAEAKAAYFSPGTGANAVFTTQGVPAQVPGGIDARYPSNNTSASESVGAIDDHNGDRAGGATQSGKTAEGFAQALASEASYQFAATPLTKLGGSTPTVPVPTVPVPTVPVPTVIPQATATPTSVPGKPTPTPCTPLPVVGGCAPVGSSGSQARSSAQDSAQDASHTGSAGGTLALSPAPVQLPDDVEQALVAQLRLAEVANPSLLKLNPNASLAAPDPTLPYAGGDISSTAATRATDAGVGVTLTTHAAKLQLFQGLISFSTIDTTLQATAPASTTEHGSGKINTKITGAAIGGIPVTIDDKGVHVVDQGASDTLIQQLSDQLNGALTKAGITISLTKPAVETDKGFWQGSGGDLDVTAELKPSSVLPSPTSGVPATHVAFSIGKVTASIYAVPGTGGGGGGGGGGGCDFCGGFGGGFGGGSGGGSPSSPGSVAVSLPLGLSGIELLALVFVVQGLATAGVAAAGGFVEQAAKAAKPVTEEETR